MSGDHGDADKHIETLRHCRDMGLDEVAFKLHRDHAASISVKKVPGWKKVPGLFSAAGLEKMEKVPCGK